MEKRIEFKRSESRVITSTYSCVFEEKDWPNFIAWLEKAYPVGATLIKKEGFNGIAKNLEGKDPRFLSWEEPNGHGNYTYTEDIECVLCEYLREIAYDNGPVDEDCYNEDGEEELLVIEEEK